MIINCDPNIDQNNRDYHFGHNRSALPYVHCFNHQLHLVVIHALAADKLQLFWQAFWDFFTMCNMLYKFCRKLTVSLLYKGQTLKRLLDQRWTGHLGMVCVILRSFDDLATLLREVNSTTAYPKDVRVEATGLMQAMCYAHA